MRNALIMILKDDIINCTVLNDTYNPLNTMNMEHT